MNKTDTESRVEGRDFSDLSPEALANLQRQVCQMLFNPLYRRQKDVIEAVFKWPDASTAELADRLGCSPRTVRNSQSSAKLKWRAGALTYGLEIRTPTGLVRVRLNARGRQRFLSRKGA